MKRLFFYFLIFILTGEFFARLDKKYVFFEKNRVVKMKTEFLKSYEHTLIKNGLTQKDLGKNRIMVLGDSYFQGGGMNYNENLSMQLKKIMNNFEKTKQSLVLDISRGSANNLNHKLSYFKFVEKFNPNVVIIGYNINDIEGQLIETDSIKQNYSTINLYGDTEKSMIEKIYDFVYSSRLLEFLLRSFHDELKHLGYVLPQSRAGNLIKDYVNNSKNWRESKDILQQIISDCQRKKIHLIIYHLPNFNLLKSPKTFKKANDVVEDFFKGNNNLYYINGFEEFKYGNEQYFLSKYDGHPNKLAHKKMAEQIFDVIKNNDLVSKP